MSGLDNAMKVVLVGDSQVGKTSILHTFMKGEFEENQKNTVGSVFHQLVRRVNNRNIVIQVWDTAGQERYKSLGPIYYRHAVAAIAVFDLTMPDWKKSVEGWIIHVKRNTDNPVFMLVGNKVDLKRPDEEELQAIATFAEKYEAEYYLTSAKTSEGLKELFDTLFQKVSATVSKRLDSVTDEVEITAENRIKCC